MPRNGPVSKASGCGRQPPQSGKSRLFWAARSGWWYANGGLDTPRQPPRAGQYLPCMRAPDRMPPTGRRRHERHQHKSAPMEFRVREK